MAQLTLIIGNKNYSSWSLRPWLVMKQSGIEFVEVRIPLDTPTTQQEILKHSPAGKVPILKHGNLTIWDSLAICEYIAELFPSANLWTQDVAKRAIARCVSAEMHSGFSKLRQHMPMNCRARLPGKGIQPAQADINRITTIWRECREKFANGGDFLSKWGVRGAIIPPPQRLAWRRDTWRNRASRFPSMGMRQAFTTAISSSKRAILIECSHLTTATASILTPPNNIG